MQDLQIFKNNEFGEIRVLEINNEPWFVGKDVAEILGYSNSKDAIKKHVDEEDKQVIQRSQFATLEIPNRGMTIINESGLYSLILSSKLPNAKKFKRWVTNEVLPSIRKHGAYMTEDTIEKALTNPDFLIQLATKLKEERELRIKAENEKIRLIHQGKLYTATEIAKELGFTSARKLNADLKDKKIQYTSNGTWVLTAKYSDRNFTSIKQHELESGKIIYDRKWTGLGRDFLLDLYGVENNGS